MGGKRGGGGEGGGRSAITTMSTQPRKTSGRWRKVAGNKEEEEMKTQTFHQVQVCFLFLSLLCSSYSLTMSVGGYMQRSTPGTTHGVTSVICASIKKYEGVTKQTGRLGVGWWGAGKGENMKENPSKISNRNVLDLVVSRASCH